MRQLTLVVVSASFTALAGSATAQPGPTPPSHDSRIGELIDAVSAERIEQDIRTLVALLSKHRK